jgi:hypothetical protein
MSKPSTKIILALLAVLAVPAASSARMDNVAVDPSGIGTLPGSRRCRRRA